MVAKAQDWYEDRAQDLWEAALKLADGDENDAIEIIKTLDLDATTADRETRRVRQLSEEIPSSSYTAERGMDTVCDTLSLNAPLAGVVESPSLPQPNATAEQVAGRGSRDAI